MSSLSTAERLALRCREVGAGTRPRRMPAADRREQLLDVAAEILIEGGDRALTMERLAEHAGVSKGLGYAYFEDAEEVALALWDREIAAVYGRIEAATGGASSVDELLERAVAAYFDVLGDRGALLGILQAGLSHGRLQRQIRNRVREFVRFWQGQLSTYLALDDDAAVATAAMAPAAVDASAQLWRLGRLSRQKAQRLACDFVLAGAHGVAER